MPNFLVLFFHLSVDFLLKSIGIKRVSENTLISWKLHFILETLNCVLQDLRGLVHGKNLADSWSTIGHVLRQLSTLKWLDFGLVPTWILHQVAECLPE